jgi:hypothetical protein
MTQSNSGYAVAYTSKYVPGATYYDDKTGYGQSRLDKAHVFDSIVDASLHLAKHFEAPYTRENFPPRIVRVVTETVTVPGSRRVLGETEAAQEGETVKYALTYKLSSYPTEEYIAEPEGLLGTPQNAKLHDTMTMAAIHLAERSRIHFTLPNAYRIVRIAVRPESTKETRRVEEIA